MDIILISHTRGRTWKFRCHPRSPFLWAPLLLLPVCALVASAVAGYRLAPAPVNDAAQVAAATELWDHQIERSRDKLDALHQRMADNFHALAQRLGQLQAHVMRLNAVGMRMTQMANLGADEFNFDQPPPMGGPESELVGGTPTVGEFKAALDAFEQELNARERQMRVLRDLMVAGELREEITPSGRPVLTGWISSTFGWRTDPFTGRRAYHEGIDFAAGLGTEVISVAAGVVTYAGPKAGYGIMVEITHGNGYVTRYGHNKKVEVEVGQRVEKGDVIAKVGATGRATGPHLHFEVLRNGRVVNPTQYIQASR